MKRAFYSSGVADFLGQSNQSVLGEMALNNQFDLSQTQRDAWVGQLDLLRKQLELIEGQVYFEFSIPRMGKRIDVLLIVANVVFVIEFKVGESTFLGKDKDQVIDYSLDLKNFHEGSHNALIQPILVSTSADLEPYTLSADLGDRIKSPIESNGENLNQIILNTLSTASGIDIGVEEWETSGYKPTPTIVEATLALYRGHRVEDIANNMAEENLSVTTKAIDEIINESQRAGTKSIIFVSGVPGAGKTLVGLDVAATHSDIENESYCVFLSGNQPLVSVLQEALTRDKVEIAEGKGEKLRKGEVRSQVKSMIQNIHHYRDEYLVDQKAPVDRIALFDEAQRVWNKTQTVNFMKQKKNQPDFDASESEFLISCMNRHEGWASIVCLVGGGQEINKGEAGIIGWLDAVQHKFKDWRVYISPELKAREYLGADKVVETMTQRGVAIQDDRLHLKTSARSFRSNQVSQFVTELLNFELEKARTTLKQVSTNYPLVLTRDVDKAKAWLKKKARGTERYGIVVSSQAERLRPHGIHVKAPIKVVDWFLNDKESVNSSYYLEDVATEFSVQGLELDWTCVIWDADFRYTEEGWGNYSFRGSKWQRIKLEERQRYQLNAYRVLLTRARQGMVICVPEGNDEDATRPKEFYDETFKYLSCLGLAVI